MRIWTIGLLCALGGFASQPPPQSVSPEVASVCAGPNSWAAEAPDRLSVPEFNNLLNGMTWVSGHREEFSRVRAYQGPRTRGPSACRAATNQDRAAEALRAHARRGQIVNTDETLAGGKLFYCLNDAERQRMEDLAAQIDINRRTLERQCAGLD